MNTPPPGDKVKGGLAREAPRRARVRVQEPNNSELLRKHSLTLIGKVTNRSVQKVQSLIPFFTDHWKTKIKPVGSDLGQGMFQFQFDSESDLLSVLEKRPFHFAKWMVILQRWEPTISPSFPSLIPFWIKVEGIPVHLWTEETIKSIGEDIGQFECSDISTLSVRMRVHVNGRLPLIKSSVIEYPNGDEVTATLVYEKLEKHCSHCYRLDHELKDCLEAKHQKKKALAVYVQRNKEQSEDRFRKLLDVHEGSRSPARSLVQGNGFPQYNGEAPPQAWNRDSKTVLDASNQSLQQYNPAGQLPPPPCYSHASNNPSGGTVLYQDQGKSVNMPQNSYAMYSSGLSNHHVSQQRYQPETSVQNQSYGPVPSYQQGNYQKTLQFAASLLHQINQNQQQPQS